MLADVGDEVFEVGAGEYPVGRDRRLVVVACERVETIYDRLEAGNSFGVRNLRWITEKMSSIWFSHDAAQHRNLSGPAPCGSRGAGPTGSCVRRSVVAHLRRGGTANRPDGRLLARGGAAIPPSPPDALARPCHAWKHARGPDSDSERDDARWRPISP